MDITKAQAKAAIGITLDTEFAAWFRDQPSKQAVSQWKDDEALPSSRQWELRARLPELFPMPAQQEAA